jgi:hypothetical protein
VRRFVTTAFVALMVLASCPGIVHAQTASAALAGRVLTEDGTPVADAMVQARLEAGGALRTAVSDRRGRYRFEGLSPGRWVVVARVGDGGLSDTRTVTLRLQQTTTIDFSVGAGLAEQVTVRAQAPLVDRRQTAGKLTVTGERAETLPLAGRVVTDLALLDSSVRQAAPGTYFGERAAVFTINGQSARSNSFLVDGVDNNDSTSGTTMNSFFSQQVIQEFVLLTHQFAPEFGGASGGVLNVITRRGDNERGWGIFAQGTVASWNEAGDFVDNLPDSGVSQDSAQRFQAGLTFSGPIRKDRSFYFVSYEHQQADDVVPFTGITGEGIPGGRMIAPQEDDNFFVRTDFNLGASHTLMVRLSGDVRSTEGVNVGGVWTPEAGFSIEEEDIQLAATLQSVISPGLLSETRLVASTSSFDQLANSDLPGVTRPSGIFGGNVLNRQERDEDKVQLVQNLTWRTGVHTTKFGFDVTRSRTEIKARFNPNGNFGYDYDIPFVRGDCDDVRVTQIPSAADDGTIHCNGDPNGVDDDMDGREDGTAGPYDCADGIDNDGDGRCDTSGSVCVDGSTPGDAECDAAVDETWNIYSYPLVYSLLTGNPEATLDDTRVAVFAQDKVEVGRRWLLEYGLRYDLSTFELPSSARVDSTIPNGGAGRDQDNLAPRFGFTFTPKADGKLIVRGGAGVFYDKLVLAFPAGAAVTSGTQIGLSFPQGFAFEFTEDNVGEDNPALVFPEPLTMRFSTGPELETPYTVQYTLGLERAIGSQSAFRADVIRALGYHLPLMKDLNPVSGLVSGMFGLPLLTGDLTACPVENIDPDLDIGVPCHARDPEHGSIAAIVTEGRSWYTGLNLDWRWGRGDSWLRASYTLSKAEDLGSDPLRGGIALPPNPEDLRGERGRSDGDRLHRLVLSGDTAVPWWGIRASAVVQLSSGMPYNVTTGQDDNLDGILTDRPPGVDRNEGEDASVAAVNAVRDQPVVPLAPIESLPDEPDFFQIDLRLYRSFRVHNGRGGGGELFLQVFNLLNRENIGLIEGRAISPDFGRAISLAGPPRTLEVGLKLAY